MADYMITAEQVRGILTDPAPTIAEVADRWRVSLPMVNLYRRGESRKAREAIAALRAEGVEPLPPIRGRERLSDAAVAEIRALGAGRESSTRIAKRLGCSPSAVRMIWSGRTYLDV